MLLPFAPAASSILAGADTPEILATLLLSLLTLNVGGAIMAAVHVERGEQAS
jgi:hypothetical protein